MSGDLIQAGGAGRMPSLVQDLQGLALADRVFQMTGQKRMALGVGAAHCGPEGSA